jgi:cell division protein FtsB
MAARIIFWLLLIGAVVFSLMGGEYSTVDLWHQRQFKQRLAAQTDSLAREVDSLRREAKAVLTDRATQERIAREQYGMVRGDKEILYRLSVPDKSKAGR